MEESTKNIMTDSGSSFEQIPENPESQEEKEIKEPEKPEEPKETEDKSNLDVLGELQSLHTPLIYIQNWFRKV